MSTDNPITNCHSHVFTADYVPNWLAKGVLPWPLFYLVPISPLVTLFRWWYKSKRSPHQWPEKTWYKQLARSMYQFKMALKRYLILSLLKILMGVVFISSILYDVYDWKLRSMLEGYLPADKLHRVDTFFQWLKAQHLLIDTNSLLLKGLILGVVLVFFPFMRKVLWLLATWMFGWLRKLPGKQTIELAKRYLTIIRFAQYKHQSGIFSRLAQQYPSGTRFVVLPMDMEFMSAGRPPKPFRQQMEELAAIKKNHPATFFPFLFIDPRRINKEGAAFLNWSAANGTVTLQDCFVKTYMETHQFSGFKIYPALGYFPFDEALLPLWKYAADHGLPIMTHCIRGVIFYRGRKKPEWDFHPVFRQYMGMEKTGDADAAPQPRAAAATAERTIEELRALEQNPDYQPMLLHQTTNEELQEIFTHPLNYLCLLDEMLLRQVVSRCGKAVQELFGYDKDKPKLVHNLKHLKICFGHFGGDDEWMQFFEKDRNLYSNELLRFPAEGIRFLTGRNDNKIKPGKPEQIWKQADWYSILCSLMLQYDNLYADISYILHSEQAVLPLLQQTLHSHPKLRSRVLYGTDFYVVRNHKSDKNMLSDMQGGLSKEDFDQIARVNPVEFLKRW